MQTHGKDMIELTVMWDESDFRHSLRSKYRAEYRSFYLYAIMFVALAAPMLRVETPWA